MKESRRKKPKVCSKNKDHEEPEPVKKKRRVCSKNASSGLMLSEYPSSDSDPGSPSNRALSLARVDATFKIPESAVQYSISFGVREIADGRPVSCKSFKDNKAEFMDEWFKFQRWDALLKERCTCYPSLVRLFYAHMDCSQPGVIKSWLKGTEINFDSSVLGEILGVPSNGIFYYPGNKWSTNKKFDKARCIKLVMMDDEDERSSRPTVDELPMSNRLLHLIIMQSINVRRGRKSSLTYCDLFIMFCLLSKIQMSLPGFMIEHMMHAQKDVRKGSLPYGMWLTKVFQYSDVQLQREISKEPVSDNIDINTVKKSLGYYYDEESRKWIKENIKRGAPAKPKMKEHVEDEREDQSTIFFGNISAIGQNLVKTLTNTQQGLVEAKIAQVMLKRTFPDIFHHKLMADLRSKVTSDVFEQGSQSSDSSDHNKKTPSTDNQEFHDSSNENLSSGDCFQHEEEEDDNEVYEFGSD